MKNNSRGIVFCMALAALAVSMMFVPIGFSAIGVEKGDWAIYSVESEVKVPEEMEEEETGEIKEMEWAKFEVISNTTTTLEGTFVYARVRALIKTKNGTEIGFIIEANLTEGDQVIAPFFFRAGVPMYINGTVSREYAGAIREVNYVNIEDMKMEEYNASVDLEAYWDKATGFLCEMSMLMSGETVEISLSFRMTENNMWEAKAEAAPFITQWWFWVIIAVIIIVAAGSVVLLLRGRKAAPAPT